jgi:hypothetical protein
MTIIYKGFVNHAFVYYEDSDNIDDYKSILTDAIIMLAITFKQSGCNPPKRLKSTNQLLIKS